MADSQSSGGHSNDLSLEQIFDLKAYYQEDDAVAVSPGRTARSELLQEQELSTMPAASPSAEESVPTDNLFESITDLGTKSQYGHDQLPRTNCQFDAIEDIDGELEKKHFDKYHYYHNRHSQSFIYPKNPTPMHAVIVEPWYPIPETSCTITIKAWDYLWPPLVSYPPRLPTTTAVRQWGIPLWGRMGYIAIST